ncbi:hypothetical protein EXIGLDRAFT_840628 [Exidia glandulosa HHB12029]|uniref:Zinc-finger domain-containing protein n=1 Tax=Exidia glandulosa HHB12029 TaxID=1314781 RepID=A0A165EC32_EXIGL|nr:hypothetical protein EXIGLDRAFT_840628 [Exidia glandulosa HHB12029]
MASAIPRRFSEVYVELPLLSPRPSTGSARSKENYPLQSPVQPHAAARLSKPSKEDVLKQKDAHSVKDASRKKRKADDALPSVTTTKKPKVDESAKDVDHVYCHQCCRKVPQSSTIHCTRVVKGMRCKLKYCNACLKNRYGEDHETVRSAGVDAAAADRSMHVSDAHGYLYTCPRCQGCCNCRTCRKAAGLEATGKISFPSGESARDVLAKNPAALEQTIEKPPKPPVAPKKKTAHPSEIVPYDEAVQTGLVKPPAKPKGTVVKDKDATAAPPKIPPEPEWHSIPTELSREEVEDRIYLREFILRFGPLMSVAKTHIDALDNFEALPDATVRALFIALLDLIAVEDEGPHRKALQAGVRDVRSAHTPTKIWAVLERLRESDALKIPDPAESSEAGAYNTRRGVTIAQGVQLLPILIALCEKALRGQSVRAEIEERTAKHAQFNRDALYAPLKEVNDPWAERRKALLEEKAKEGVDLKAWKAKYKKEETQHKAEVADIEQTHYEHVAEYARRFRALGRDYAGRTYYLLSAQKVKKLPSEGERESFARWAWFVAVHGTAKDCEWDAEEEAAEGWWAFGTPKDVRALSKWLVALALNDAVPKERDDVVLDSPLSMLSDEEEEIDTPTQQMERYYGPKPTLAEVKTMCKHLDEFADYLEWRLAKDVDK